MHRQMLVTRKRLYEKEKTTNSRSRSIVVFEEEISVCFGR